MDPVTGAALISAGGSLLGGLFGKKKKEAPATQVTGFAALPKEVQNAWLQTYLPQVLEQDKRPYEAPPLLRAPTQAGIFDSQGLADLQRYSDSLAPSGGLFPYKDPNAPPPAPALTPQATADQQALALYGMNMGDYVNQQRGDVAKQYGYATGKINANDPRILDWWQNFGKNRG